MSISKHLCNDFIEDITKTNGVIITNILRVVDFMDYHQISEVGRFNVSMEI